MRPKPVDSTPPTRTGPPMKKDAVNVALTRVALLFIEALPRKEETSTLSMRVVTATSSHCVLTATLVEPRVTAPESLNRTKILLAAGSNETLPLPCTKIPNVGVAPAAIVVVQLP